MRSCMNIATSSSSAIHRASTDTRVFLIRGGANGVSLYFNRGKELPDPAKLLQGSGGVTRFTNVAGASTLARPEITRLVDEAIDRNRVPFARAGRGSLVVRPTSAKKRRQKSK